MDCGYTYRTFLYAGENTRCNSKPSSNLPGGDIYLCPTECPHSEGISVAAYNHPHAV